VQPREAGGRQNRVHCAGGLAARCVGFRLASAGRIACHASRGRQQRTVDGRDLPPCSSCCRRWVRDLGMRLAAACSALLTGPGRGRARTQQRRRPRNHVSLDGIHGPGPHAGGRCGLKRHGARLAVMAGDRAAWDHPFRAAAIVLAVTTAPPPLQTSFSGLTAPSSSSRMMRARGCRTPACRCTWVSAT